MKQLVVFLSLSFVALGTLSTSTIQETLSAEIDSKSDVANDLHFYQLDNPLDVIRELANLVCGGLSVGIVSQSIEISCSDGSCKAIYDTRVSYYEGDAFITPWLDILLPKTLYEAETIKSIGHIHQFSSERLNKPLSLSIEITQEGMPRNELTSTLGGASRCARAVGNKMVERGHPYEIGTIVTGASIDRNQYHIDQLDHALLIVSHPHVIKRDGEFPIEVRLICSQKIGAETYSHDNDKAEDEVIEALRSVLNDAANKGAASDLSPGISSKNG